MLVKLDHFPGNRGENRKCLKPAPSHGNLKFNLQVCLSLLSQTIGDTSIPIACAGFGPNFVSRLLNSFWSFWCGFHQEELYIYICCYSQKYKRKAKKKESDVWQRNINLLSPSPISIRFQKKKGPKICPTKSSLRKSVAKIQQSGWPLVRNEGINLYWLVYWG